MCAGKAATFGLPIAATAASRFSFFLPQITTFASWAASSRAISKPMPLLPPVTTTTFPSSP